MPYAPGAAAPNTTAPNAVASSTVAPGAPGIAPRWTSSDKDGVGVALSPLSRVWFTLSHGILNEIYHPRVDQACTRDCGLLVAAPGFFSEEKRDATHALARLADGVPAFRLTNRCHEGRYEIVKEIVSDPRRDVVLQRVRFTPLAGERSDYGVYVLLAPHLVNAGSRNTAWLTHFKGEPMLFAEGAGTALALAASRPWRARSVGFVGASDGWQDVSRHHRMAWCHDRAEDGNVALTAQLDLAGEGATDEPLVIAIGFGRTWSEAAFRARASLQGGFDAALAGYAAGWHGWQAGLRPLDRWRASLDRAPGSERHNTYRISTSVLRAHDSPAFPGGFIASLSIPWGASKGDDDLGGYHLVWPRDLVQTAGALLAAGAPADARRVLDWLAAAQESDGHWPQNSWLDGTPYWHGIQLDESAFPVLLVDLARREGALDAAGARHFWPMVRRAAEFMLRNGPVTAQDRWEEDAGYSPYTLAVAVAALLAAADLAEAVGEADAAALLRDSADGWNDRIEEWCWVEGSAPARRAGVRGHYVRIGAADELDALSPVAGEIVLRNQEGGDGRRLAADVVSPDALALVRFGLRAADDPRIRDTVAVIDRELRAETPAGPCWRRYNGDGYGEHADGRPFDGSGVGRLWPLLTGERAHHALAAGRREEAEALLATLEGLVSDGGLLPEQVWDGPALPERELFPGRPAGSAMPLVWAHAEHVKLLRSLAEERVFDMPPQTVERYLRRGVRPGSVTWRRDSRAVTMPAGRRLRLELTEPALVHWSLDGWASATDSRTGPPVLGVHVLELPTEALAAGGRVLFTFLLLNGQGWIGVDHGVRVV
ncbi:glucan 1,4-alpha-glucosidase [Roseomonas sp. NAR14]|uniref:Glucan 1,4-alpha-glucosidase n=1 Tax=Roseomonas acroporae TaxID=2937791 RepID=A0A9X1Y5Q4_9PROT|nr:glucan 1,4-alpha-glucosidase [Roseomonas acroporae]MCK8783592.1 glucan 1,4-alpha-glucosidase [Roseomonas acroporae]